MAEVSNKNPAVCGEHILSLRAKIFVVSDKNLAVCARRNVGNSSESNNQTINSCSLALSLTFAKKYNHISTYFANSFIYLDIRYSSGIAGV